MAALALQQRYNVKRVRANSRCTSVLSLASSALCSAVAIPKRFARAPCIARATQPRVIVRFVCQCRRGRDFSVAQPLRSFFSLAHTRGAAFKWTAAPGRPSSLAFYRSYGKDRSLVKGFFSCPLIYLL